MVEFFESKTIVSRDKNYNFNTLLQYTITFYIKLECVVADVFRLSGKRSCGGCHFKFNKILKSINSITFIWTWINCQRDDVFSVLYLMFYKMRNEFKNFDFYPPHLIKLLFFSRMHCHLFYLQELSIIGGYGETVRTVIFNEIQQIAYIDSSFTFPLYKVGKQQHVMIEYVFSATTYKHYCHGIILWMK